MMSTTIMENHQFGGKIKGVLFLTLMIVVTSNFAKGAHLTVILTEQLLEGVSPIQYQVLVK